MTYTFAVLPGSGVEAPLVTGINTFGDVVGRFFDTTGAPHAFLYTHSGEFIELRYPTATLYGTLAADINDSGQIVGSYSVDGRTTAGFIYQNGAYSDLNAGSASIVIPTAVNNFGTVVGYYSIPGDGGLWHGFIDDGNGFRGLSFRADVGSTLVDDINDAGIITGRLMPLTGGTYGFAGSEGHFVRLSDAAQGIRQFGLALNVNNLGEVVGNYYDRRHHAVIYKDHVFTKLSDPDAGTFGTVAQSTNNSGDVVGYFYDGQRHSHGYLFHNAEFDTIDFPTSHLYSTVLNKIGDGGVLAGAYVDNATKQTHSFVATPNNNQIDIVIDQGFATGYATGPFNQPTDLRLDALRISAPIVGSITGNGMDNLIVGSNGNDSLNGDAGNDTLIGGKGDDVLDGGDGNDRLAGGLGGDIISGGMGNDRMFVDDQNDIANEALGGGIDAVITTVDYTLSAGSELEILRARSDTGLILTGNEFNNTIKGGAGEDTLSGGGGIDKLIGGMGADSFLLHPSGFATIADFEKGTDTIDFLAAEFGFLPSANIAVVNARSVTAAWQPGTSGYFIFDTSGANAHTLYFDPSGSSGSDAIAIGKLNGIAELSSADFSLI